VLTLAMTGLPVTDWPVYCEPIHALVYTPTTSPAFPRVMEQVMDIYGRLTAAVAVGRVTSRPGLLDALVSATVNGSAPGDAEIVGALLLLITGGFDTTTALTAHSLEYLGSGYRNPRG
jgi:cytochrome P450